MNYRTLEVVRRLESNVAEPGRDLITSMVVQASAAISLKRIADSLEKITTEVSGTDKKLSLTEALLKRLQT